MNFKLYTWYICHETYLLVFNITYFLKYYKYQNITIIEIKFNQNYKQNCSHYLSRPLSKPFCHPR